MNSLLQRIKEGKKGKREKRKGEKMVLQGRPQRAGAGAGASARVGMRAAGAANGNIGQHEMGSPRGQQAQVRPRLALEVMVAWVHASS